MQDENAGDLDLGGEAGASPDVFADTPADGGLGGDDGAPAPEAPAPEAGQLGGDGATLEELGEEPLPDDAPPINGGEEPGEAPVEEPPPAEEPPAEPEPEPAPPIEEPPAPEPEPETKPETKAKAKGGKKGTTERTYVVLQQLEIEGVGTVLKEAIEGGVVAGNGEQAMRTAYAELVDEDKGDPVTLAVIPQHYFKPKTVQAKVKHERAVEIS